MGHQGKCQLHSDGRPIPFRKYTTFNFDAINNINYVNISQHYLRTRYPGNKV